MVEEVRKNSCSRAEVVFKGVKEVVVRPGSFLCKHLLERQFHVCAASLKDSEGIVKASWRVLR